MVRKTFNVNPRKYCIRAARDNEIRPLLEDVNLGKRVLTIEEDSKGQVQGIFIGPKRRKPVFTPAVLSKRDREILGGRDTDYPLSENEIKMLGRDLDDPRNGRFAGSFVRQRER